MLTRTIFIEYSATLPYGTRDWAIQTMTLEDSPDAPARGRSDGVEYWDVWRGSCVRAMSAAQRTEMHFPAFPGHEKPRGVAMVNTTIRTFGFDGQSH